MTIQELFIVNLKDYRKLRKISQFQLAERCDSSQTYIAEIEVGKKFPSLDMIERIAAALNVESYFLFQNMPPETGTQERALSPVQRQEIADKIYSAVTKIVSHY
ncbi:MAG: helix-turn-helix domain-containing protein [Treponema sp.]|jgi:transcriptional regulator with XRE-family HTH domain|nr:helix-turn-helix domain-containing protein [Treponema sp.]